MNKAVRATLVASVVMVSGCSTVPKTAAIQKIAVGGGFIATGTVTLAGVAVGAVAGAVAGSSVPPEQAAAFNQTLLLAAAIPLAIGVAEVIGGAVLLSHGGAEIDEADRLERDPKRPRPKPERRDTSSPPKTYEECRAVGGQWVPFANECKTSKREISRPKPKPVRTAPTETPMLGPAPEEEPDDDAPPR